jgi:sugar diacid utilization regulator
VTPQQLAELAEGLIRKAAAGGDAASVAAELARAGKCRVWLESSAAPPPDGVAVALPPGAPAKWLCAAANGRAVFEPKAFEPALRVAAAAIGLAAGAAPQRTNRDAFWQRAAAGEFADAEAASDAAATAGVSLAPAYVAIALYCETGETGGADAMRTLLRQAYGSGDDVAVLRRPQCVLAFVPVRREVDASNARTAAALLPRRAEKQRAGWKIGGGAGTVESPHLLAAAVASAETAMAVGRRAFGPNVVALYEGLGALRLLHEGADAGALQRFAREALQPVRAHDRKHQTELERTLRVFFETGQNVKLAAAALNVHRHTVMYRLRQIGEIGPYSLERPYDELTLRMAVAIDALHST